MTCETVSKKRGLLPLVQPSLCLFCGYCLSEEEVAEGEDPGFVAAAHYVFFPGVVAARHIVGVHFVAVEERQARTHLEAEVHGFVLDGDVVAGVALEFVFVGDVGLEVEGEIGSGFHVPADVVGHVEVEREHDGHREGVAQVVAGGHLQRLSGAGVERRLVIYKGVAAAARLEEEAGLHRDVVADVEVSHDTGVEAGAPRAVVVDRSEVFLRHAVGGVYAETGAELEDFFGLAGVEKFLCTGREEGAEAEYGECDTFHSGNIAILKLNPVKKLIIESCGKANKLLSNAKLQNFAENPNKACAFSCGFSGNIMVIKRKTATGPQPSCRFVAIALFYYSGNVCDNHLILFRRLRL